MAARSDGVTQPATTTVRVDSRTHATLAALAAETGQSMQTIMAEAVEAYFRRHFVEAANAEYAALQRDNPAAWAELEAETRLWDGTLADGLADLPAEEDA